MSRMLTILMASLMLLSACGLERKDETAVITPIASLNPNLVTATPGVNTPTVTATVAPTATPTRTTNSNTGNNTGNPRPNCTVRTDWPVYTVVAGDTLAVIAQRVNSTVNDLTAANCLANANTIQVGQQLRVPRLPQQNTTPEITLFRVIGTPVTGGSTDGRSLEWQTRGAAQVLITQIPPSGTGGVVLGKFAASGTLPIGKLGAEYVPTATFYLYLLDASGKEIANNGNLISKLVQVSVSGNNQPQPTTFNASPNPVAKGTALTLTWNVPNANKVSLSRLNFNNDGGELIARDLPKSGSYTYTIPTDWPASNISFTLNDSSTNGHSADYDWLTVSVVPNTTCTVRTDWNLYTPPAGITLEGLANISGLSVADILYGNCWSDATSYGEGVPMRVPVMPYYKDQIAENFRCGGVYINGNGRPGFIGATQQLSHCFSVVPNTTITMNISAIPVNAEWVEYWQLLPNGETNVLGTDNDLSNGAYVEVQVGPGLEGIIYAFIYTTAGMIETEQVAIYTE